MPALACFPGIPSGEMLVCRTWFFSVMVPSLPYGRMVSTAQESDPPFCVTQSDKSTELMDNGREGGEMGQIKESKHPEEHLKL